MRQKSTSDNPNFIDFELTDTVQMVWLLNIRKHVLMTLTNFGGHEIWTKPYIEQELGIPNFKSWYLVLET